MEILYYYLGFCIVVFSAMLASFLQQDKHPSAKYFWILSGLFAAPLLAKIWFGIVLGV